VKNAEAKNTGSTRRSICLLTNAYPDFPDSNRVVFVRKLAGLIAERGYDVSIVAPRVFDGSKARESEGAIEIRRFSSFLGNKLLAEYEQAPVFRLIFYMLSGILATARCVRDRNFGLIHAHWVVPAGVIAVIAGFVCRRPVVVTAHGSDLLVVAEKSRVVRWLARFVLRRADAVTSVAEHLTDRIVEWGIPRDRILTFPMSVPTDSFRPEGDKPDGWEGKAIVFSNRNHYPVYNVETLVKAARIVLEKAPNAEFVIAGEGPEKPNLMSLASELGVVERVGFVGSIPNEDMPEYLREAAVYVSTALSDGASVSLLEAMACGTYPVVADIAANREWIEDGKNGSLFEAGNAGALADRILEGIDDDHLRAKAREVNPRIIEQRAQWESNIEKLLGLCERAMSRQRARAGERG